MCTERESYLAALEVEQGHADKLGISLRLRDYTKDRLGVMAQNVEKMLLKKINE